jgi:arsenite oxidase small subunit
MSGEKKDGKNEVFDEKRRNFLKLLFAAGAIATIGGLGSIGRYLTPQFTYAKQWPVLKITTVDALETMKPLTFYYPVTNAPNYLIKLGVQAQGGVGPDKDIVAFSAICQHLGCYYNVYAGGEHPGCGGYSKNFSWPTPYAWCCCHGSHYDLIHGGAVMNEPGFTSPAPLPLPQAKLQVDSQGNIIITGMGPPNIYGFGPGGRTTNPNDILLYDTFNGQLVDQNTILNPPANV